MNVLVYSGHDTASTSLAHTFAYLRTLLTPNYAVQPINRKTLQNQPWQASCSLLVFPPFQPSATPDRFASATQQKIQEYIAGGGKLLVLRTGVHVAAPWGQGAGDGSTRTVESVPPEKLTLEDGDGHGLPFSLVPSSQPEEEGATDTTPIPLAHGGWLKGVLRAGVVDIPLTQTSSQRVEPLVPYIAACTFDVAAIRAFIGLGAAVFWSAHIEALITSDPEQEKMCLQALRTSLKSLGLHLPATSGEVLGAIPRPTPQVLTGAPWRASVVRVILRALGVPALASTASYKFKGGYDTFLFHPQEDVASVFAEQREAAKTLSDDPEMWNSKHIVIYGDDVTPPKELTPQFDIGAYYENLKSARSERGCRETYRDGGWRIGEALLYGEIVTSTQTMIDKNARLLDTLPTPLLSLASTQLTGRGRGANVWLSPPGCLMFSLLLRVPLAVLPAEKLVFVQYLFALAIVEACREDGVLGNEAGSRVRIKWPNDIYAITWDEEKQKVGGILVHTSFAAGKFEVVVGCGLNVLNDPPIPSLMQLLPDGRTPPTMERTLAEIMARFESMWADFLYTRGSFELFMGLFLERWLHSDQEVTLTTVNPSRKARIIGITLNHGLLRTLLEPGRDGRMKYVDLQPDGNSFDLLAGLINTKDRGYDTALSPPCWTTNDPLSIRHSMALHPALPIDILEEVINQAGDNTMSLQCLSLTCKVFLPRARYHLFSSIRITTAEQLDISGEFFASRPRIAPLVRRVALRTQIRTKDKPAFVLDVVPVRLFSRLPNLCSWSMGSDLYHGRCRLSLHRLTLSCYRRYSASIQHLEVSDITLVYNISDLTRLVSAFTAIRTLACSSIRFRGTKGHSSSTDGSGTNIIQAAQTLRIKTLHIGADVDIRVVEFLLMASASTMNSIILTVETSSDPMYANDIHRLQNLASRLPQLFSLTLRLHSFGSSNDSISQAIRYATQILQHIQRTHLSHVLMEFELMSIVDLGRFLDKDGPPLEERKALEEMLLSCKAPGRILVGNLCRYARAGRTQFWRPAIERAFPRMNELGLPTIMRAGTTDPLGHERRVASIVVSHDSKRIATASWDGTIIIWGVERGTVVHEWVAHQGDEVNGLALSPDSQ